MTWIGVQFSCLELIIDTLPNFRAAMRLSKLDKGCYECFSARHFKTADKQGSTIAKQTLPRCAQNQKALRTAAPTYLSFGLLLWDLRAALQQRLGGQLSKAFRK